MSETHRTQGSVVSRNSLICSLMGRSNRRPPVRTEWCGAILFSLGRSVQISTNSTALASLGSPEPGGAAHMAPEACLQPVHLDIWSQHEGSSCWRPASLQKPQRILPEEAETTSTASMLFAQCGKRRWRLYITLPASSHPPKEHRCFTRNEQIPNALQFFFLFAVD